MKDSTPTGGVNSLMWVCRCGRLPPRELLLLKMLTANFADERDEAKGAILNYLERSEILARNISLQNNLEKN